MNLREIREECWTRARGVDTQDSERLWTLEEMNQYINRVYFYIAKKTLCIRDSLTPAVCQIPVAPPVSLAELEALALTNANFADDLQEYNTEGSWMYHLLVAPRVFPLHESILDIDEVKWHNLPWRLTKVSVVKWQQNPYWERVVGYPTEVATDYLTGHMAVNYRFLGTDSLRLTVKRLPLVKLINDEDVPEFRINYHDLFVNGVLEQMYSKQDSECLDVNKQIDYRAKFMADVDEIKRQENVFSQRLRPNHSLSAFR